VYRFLNIEGARLPLAISRRTVFIASLTVAFVEIFGEVLKDNPTRVALKFGIWALSQIAEVYLHDFVEELIRKNRVLRHADVRFLLFSGIAVLLTGIEIVALFEGAANTVPPLLLLLAVTALGWAETRPALKTLLPKERRRYNPATPKFKRQHYRRRK
jgi:hypothetical protein